MELEFDKEIDAILRRARETRGVLVGDDPPKTHLDADTIAAFAENALPQKAKLVYMEHFADCDICRKHLSRAMIMNTEADATAASPISAPGAETDYPWYQGLFRTQNLGLAMGALVLTFSGVLGYLVLQNREDARNSAVSQITEQEPTRGGPFVGDETSAANANGNAAMPNSADKSDSAANAPAPNSMTAAPSSNAQPSTAGRVDSTDDAPVSRENSFILDGVDAVPAKPATAAPPPPLEAAAGERDETKADAKSLKEENKDLELAKRKQNEDRGNRDAPPPAAKMGPSRSGPLQNQSNQTNTNVFDMAVTRAAGGKTFNNRNGAWYDSAYRGQATTNVRRSADEYKKLDRGLRNIADNLGGTVVVVWKEKAYRIQ